jgi:hypothetical protein
MNETKAKTKKKLARQRIARCAIELNVTHNGVKSDWAVVL